MFELKKRNEEVTGDERGRGREGEVFVEGDEEGIGDVGRARRGEVNRKES